MNKEEQKRLKDAEEEGVKARAAQTQIQKERDEIRRERDALKIEKDQLNLSLRDNMNHVDGLNKQLQDFAKDYSEIGLDLIKTREEKELLKRTLKEIVDNLSESNTPGKMRRDEKLIKAMDNAKAILNGDTLPNVRPTPTERKRALQEKRKARMSR